MQVWHQQQLKNLTQGIINEFEYLTLKIAKDDSIYAAALITDEDVMTAFLALGSQKEYLKNANPYGYWGERWAAVEWEVSVGSKDVNGGISELYLPQMYKFYEEVIEPQDDYDEYRASFIELYTQAFKLAKVRLSEKYGSEVANAVFFLDVPGEDEIAIESAKIINEPSEMLDQMLDDIE